jgi:hypothetical protein
MNFKQRLTAATATPKRPSRRTVIDGEGLSAFELSKSVNLIEVGLWHSGRVSLQTKIAVLRALADRYPNIWSSVKDISKKAHCGTTAVRIALRELEREDGLIAEILPQGQKAKIGGRRNTVQYRFEVDAVIRLLEQQGLIKQIVADAQKVGRGKATGTDRKTTEIKGKATASDAKDNGYRWGSNKGRNHISR